MNPDGLGEGRLPRRSLRVRLIALVMGTGIVPFALALLLLFPVFRREVSDAQGLTLAREAAFLAAQVDVYLRAHADTGKGEALRVVDSFRRGRRGRAYLYDSTGGRLAGLPDLPAIPSAQGRPSPGWQTFEFGRVTYFAGVAVVPGTLPGGPWYLAVVQPESELLTPLWNALRSTGLFFAGIAGLALFLSWRLGEAFFVPLSKLRQGAEIISHINLAHRIDIRTGDELEGMAQEFNRMAESLQSSYGELEERVRQTTLHLSEERNRLAGVLRTMTEGVVMTNEAGVVVLATPRARLTLGARASSGIGLPLSDLLPGERLDFHLKRVRRDWTEGRERAEAVVFPLADGRLLRGALSAVRGPSGELAGFLLVFRDLNATGREGAQTEETLKEIPRLLKGPAATLRSLVEVLEGRPDMAEAKRQEFLRAIHEEVVRILDRLRSAEMAAGLTESDRWPVVAADPRDLLAEAVGDLPDLQLVLDIPPDERAWVQVEPYSWVRALSAVVRWLRGQAPSLPLEVKLVVEDEAVVAGFRVPGLSVVDASELENETVAPIGEEALSLGEVVRRNRGELWTRRSGEGFEVRLALVRAAVAGRTGAKAIAKADSQPEFYDFDLFLPHPASEPADLLDTPLADLEYVVFDTETTGLNPSQGDEVVSIGALRVRRGKVVAADTFHTLVRPSRPIPAESTRFHGIDDAMVADAPTIAEVLPQFRAYVGDSVLVAHNAAFDKKFLDLAAAAARLAPIETPMLDTLFLSYGVHRDFEGHNLEGISRRLGIEVSGRHTSLGDARATAEILLGLLPLLEARGIVTLGEAKAFCDKMLLFRWRTSRF